MLPVRADDRHHAERHRERAHAGDGPEDDRPAVGDFPLDDAAGEIVVKEAGLLPAPGEVFGDHALAALQAR